MKGSVLQKKNLLPYLQANDATKFVILDFRKKVN
jgi:hypothetical protein